MGYVTDNSVGFNTRESTPITISMRDYQNKWQLRSASPPTPLENDGGEYQVARYVGLIAIDATSCCTAIRTTSTRSLDGIHVQKKRINQTDGILR